MMLKFRNFISKTEAFNARKAKKSLAKRRYCTFLTFKCPGFSKIKVEEYYVKMAHIVPSLHVRNFK